MDILLLITGALVLIGIWSLFIHLLLGNSRNSCLLSLGIGIGYTIFVYLILHYLPGNQILIPLVPILYPSIAADFVSGLLFGKDILEISAISTLIPSTGIVLILLSKKNRKSSIQAFVFVLTHFIPSVILWFWYLNSFN